MGDLMSAFQATHVIDPDSSNPTLVMLDDNGAAYTREEWRDCVNADYEFDGNHWTFQGNPIASSRVRRLDTDLTRFLDAACSWWTRNGKRIEPEGYNALDYFDDQGRYKGPDSFGVGLEWEDS